MAGSLAVFGASGNTGRAVVEACVRKDIRVRALYRPGSEPQDSSSDHDIVTGQLSSKGDVQRILSGVDGAIIVFGPRLGGPFRKPTVPPQPFCAAATANVIAGMRELGIRRIVCQTGAMAGDGNLNCSGMVRRFVRSYRRRFPAIAADRDEQERVVRECGLDWTLVKPFRISGARGVGRVRAAPSIRIGAFASIRRTDLADFLVEEAVAGRFHGQAVYAVKG